MPPPSRLRPGRLLALVPALGVAACTGKPVPGDPSTFDPVGMLSTLQAEVGEAFAVTRIEAEGVRPDGRIDLTDKVVDGNVRYRFVRAVDPPANQPPLGAGGSAEPVWHEEARVHVRRRGWHNTGTRQDGDGGTVNTYDRSRGLDIRHLDPRPGAPQWNHLDREPESPDEGPPVPACDFARLWEVALERGAPRNAVATIGFSQGRYSFRITGTDVNIRFREDCTPF